MNRTDYWVFVSEMIVNEYILDIKNSHPMTSRLFNNKGEEFEFIVIGDLYKWSLNRAKGIRN